MNSDGRDKLFMSYYSDKDVKLTLELKNKETIRVKKIEFINDRMTMVTLDNDVSRVIEFEEIAQINL